jgi:hypothetical protein
VTEFVAVLVEYRDEDLLEVDHPAVGVTAIWGPWHQ